MFGIDASVLAVVVLIALAAGGLAYALLFNTIDAEKNTDRRMQSVSAHSVDGSRRMTERDRNAEAVKRRKHVETSLKELDAKQQSRDAKTTRAPLRRQLQQAGLAMNLNQFYLFSLAFGIVFALACVFFGLPLLFFPLAFIAGAFGIPRWWVNYMKKRRITQFLDTFADSIDVIVRAVKSGLPLNDGIKLIAAEAKDPVRGEFRRIVDAQQAGLSIPEAAGRMGETMPCPEANFFGIVIQIQSQAGGNLSEALGNLSRVLRDRKKMKAKVAALSMEAKASAVVIGSLPFVVVLLVYLTTPAYISLLFTTETGNIILVASGIWMSIGIYIMKQMISFDI